jgi:hypothetical protein
MILCAIMVKGRGTTMRTWAARIGRLVLAGLVSGVMLAGCGRDKGDPVKISRDFIVANWTGDVETVEMLTCKDWRSVTTGWAQSGDPSLTVDAGHLKFEVTAKTDSLVELVMSGMVTFKSANGQTEVRNLDEGGAVRFILVDEHGWKVCDLRDWQPDQPN